MLNYKIKSLQNEQELNTVLELSKLSSRYRVKKLMEEDIPEMLSLCKGNPIYYKYFKIEPTSENLKESLNALPPKKTMEDKYFVGFYEGDQLVSILDLIRGYPNQETAYIGWFMMDQTLQGAGIGSKIITELIGYLKERQFRYVQLGYIKENPQAKHFWIKNNFHVVGSEVESAEYTIVNMRREI